MGKAWARFTAAREVVDFRRGHFFNDSRFDPVVKIGDDEQCIQWQSDVARQKWEDLKARLNENHSIVHVSPQEQTVFERSAEDLEAVLNAIVMIAEERNGYTLQDAMADGQLVDGYAVLHWRRFSQGWPKVPENEYLDELPEDDETDDEFTKARKKKLRSRFERDEDDDGNVRYRETDKSVQERTKHLRARAGSPYEIEVIDCNSFAWIEDRVSNVGIGVVVRETGVVDYNDAQGDKLRVVVDNAKRLHVIEGSAPKEGDPSKGDWDTIAVATLWTKDEWYELASPDALVTGAKGEVLRADSWELVKAGTHAFGRAPFEIVPASMFHPSSDPAMKYLPSLEGVFRVKPHYDRFMALTMVMTERHAVPDVLIEDQPNALPTITETGDDINTSTNSAQAGHVQGGKLTKIDIQLSSSVPQMTDRLGAMQEEASPDTGLGEITTGTEPWTARLMLSSSNVKPKDLLNKQQAALRSCLRSIARDMATPVEEGGIGDIVWVYKRGDDGESTGEIVGVHTEEIPTLNISVSIDATSSAERITLVEHGVSLFERGHILQKTLLEDYMNIPNPTEYAYDLAAEKIFKTQIEPGLIQQVVAAEVGSQYVLGPDGQVINGQGQVQQPGAVAESQGWRRMKPQQQMPPLTDSAPPQVGMRQANLEAVG